MKPSLITAVALASLAAILCVSAEGQPEALAGASWRPLRVRVVSARGRWPLPRATIEIEVLGAPVWDGPKKVIADAAGTAVVPLPRWGGPVRLTARAEEHLPVGREVGAEAGVTLELPHLPRTGNRVQLTLVDDGGQPLSPLVIPTHALLVIRAYGPNPQAQRFLTWSVPARQALEEGVGLPFGATDLAFRAASWRPAWTRIVLPDDRGPTIPLPERSLQPLELLVVDKSTGEPLSGAIVRFTQWGDGQAQTGPDGRITVPYLPGEEIPEALALKWALPGWVRARWYESAESSDAGVVWSLGMHRVSPKGLSVTEPGGEAVESGIAWSSGGPWPRQRWPIEGGHAEVSLPADEEDGDLEFRVASRFGFASLSAAKARETARVELRPWRRVRVRVDRVGTDCPGTCQVGLHLLAEKVSSIRPSELSPWLWTAPISGAGEIDTVVPAGDDVALQVDIGSRTAFFSAKALALAEWATLRIGPEFEADRRTLLLLGEDAAPASEVRLGLRWTALGGAPPALDLLYEGQTDAEGLFRHYGPPGPYEVWLLEESGNRRIGTGFGYAGGDVGVVRLVQEE